MTSDIAFLAPAVAGYLGGHTTPPTVLVDNVLWDGTVVDDADTEPDTIALREFNDAVLNDARLDVAMLPVGDGVSMITLSRT